MQRGEKLFLSEQYKMVSSISNMLTVLKTKISGTQVEAGAARGWRKRLQEGV